jgi:hypothetical protein
MLSRTNVRCEIIKTNRKPGDDLSLAIRRVDIPQLFELIVGREITVFAL